jgi:hypothetical protein
MRLILFLMIALCFQLKAQDANKTAQTAGGEFLDKQKQEQNQSITASTTYTELITTVEPYKEKTIVGPKGMVYASSNTTTSTLIYIIAFLLAGIALFFITQNRKNQMLLRNEIHFEEEDEQDRKKQLWNAMSEPETE